MSLRTTRIHLSPKGTWVRMATFAALGCGYVQGVQKPVENAAAPASAAAPAADEAPPPETFYIRQYRLKGTTGLPRIDVEASVYPFMGPECTDVHIRMAEESLRKAYDGKGFSVQIASQRTKHGVVVMQVIETKVGRVMVKGSWYFSLDRIKREFPSLTEGKLLNSKDFQRDMRAAARYPDRQILIKKDESLKPREGEPGVVDVNLFVEDKLPLHGSLEVNNRNSPDTTKTRINGSISYGNLWQAGHTLGLSFQVAPERLADAKVFSGFYTIPVPQVEGMSVTLSGTKQDSDINTLGGAGVLGRGYMMGARVNKLLPQGKNWVHSVSGGFDFKHFDQDLTLAGITVTTPIDYFPMSVTYNGTHLSPSSSTDFNASLVFNIRSFASAAGDFDAKRFKADGGFTILRADLSHTQDFRNGMQLFARAQGQLASGPLVNSEQFSGGGLSNVRGYLESAVQGDNAIAGTVELRSPSLIAIHTKEGETRPSRPNQWRFYAFGDAGYLSNYDPLPDQDSTFPMASVGVGTAFRVKDHYNGSLDVGVPLIDEGTTDAGDILVTFRVWTDF